MIFISCQDCGYCGAFDEEEVCVDGYLICPKCGGEAGEYDPDAAYDAWKDQMMGL